MKTEEPFQSERSQKRRYTYLKAKYEATGKPDLISKNSGHRHIFLSTRGLVLRTTPVHLGVSVWPIPQPVAAGMGSQLSVALQHGSPPWIGRLR